MPALTTIKLRRGTAAQWAAANPVLAVGEPGLETDTNVLKHGDGVTAWASLPVALSGTYVQYVTGLVSDGVALDGPAIQAKLDAATPGTEVRVPFVGDGICLINAPLVLPAGGKCRLVFDPGVEIRLAPGSNCNMINNSAVSATASGAMDGAATAASSAVTSAAFTAERAGQAFTIWGAGPRYRPLWGPMHGTVTGVGTGTLNSRTEAATTEATTTPNVLCSGITDADLGQPVTGSRIPVNAYVGAVFPGYAFDIHVAGLPANSLTVGADTITIGGAAVNTIADTYVSVGPRDQDIEIVGGLWNREANQGSGFLGYSFRIRRCDGVKILGAKHKSTLNTNGVYAIELADVTKYVVDDHDLAVARDGVHIDGPAFTGRITNIRGRTGDDMVSLTIGNYAAYQDTLGPIIDCHVDGLQLRNCSSGVCLTGNSQIFPYDQIVVANVSGNARKGALVRCQDDAFMPDGTRIETLTIRGLKGTNSGSQNAYINWSAAFCRNLIIEDANHDDVLTFFRQFTPVFPGLGCTIEKMTVNGFSSVRGATNILFRFDSRIDIIQMAGVNVAFAASGGVLVRKLATSTDPTRLLLSDFDVRGKAAGQGILITHNAAAGKLTALLSNGSLYQLNTPFSLGAEADINLSNVRLDTTANATWTVNDAAAVVRVVAEGTTQVGGTSITVTAGGQIGINGRNYRANAFQLTPVLHDEIYNTNANAAQVPAGVGPLHWDGSAWTTGPAGPAGPTGPAANPYIAEAIVAAVDVRYMRSVGVTVAVANRALFFRIPGNFCAERAITKLRAYVQVQSGNWDMGVYDDDGTNGAPGTLLASLGGGATPAPGPQQVTIPSTVVGPGHWLAIAADNITATFLGMDGSIVTGIGAMAYFQASAYPLPATAAPSLGVGRVIYVEGLP